MTATVDSTRVATSVGDDPKRLSTAAARAALLAGSLIERRDDAGATVFVLTRWAKTREFRDIADVERVLDIMGASDI